MSRVIALLCCLLFAVASWSQDAFVVKNIKSDFGALGDGRSNDHQAFSDACRFFNERKGNGRLIIPAGTYLVGRQMDYGALVPLSYRFLCDDAYQNPYYKLGIPVIYLSGCSNIEIVGADTGGRSIIRFGDSLLLGSFERGKPMPEGVVPPAGKVALIGDAVYMERCTGVRIRHLELDGNLPAHIIGGPVTADGLQAGQSGIALVDVTHADLEFLEVSRFAVDGLQVRNITAATMEQVQSQHINLVQCDFLYNGRQGFSWTGGAGLTARECSFSKTGRAINRSLGKPLSTAPGAGLDIEPESDPHIGAYRLVKDAEFSNCRFEDNAGVSMIADLYDAREYRAAQDVRFNNCIFRGTTFWSIWVTHPGFRFSGCRIAGAVVHSYSGNMKGMETTFTKCHFEDDKPGLYGEYLVEIADGKRTTFDSCVFTARRKKFYYLVSSDPKNAKFLLRNCTFINASGSARAKECIAEGVEFSGRRDIDRPGAR